MLFRSLHLDLMGPTRIESLGGKRYIMVVVDDFTRYTWIILLRSKFDAPKHIETLCTRLQNEKSLKIDRIRSDHGKEFENSYMESFLQDQASLKNSLLLLLLSKMV